MSSLLGPVTDADLRRWQRKRHVLLGEFLDLADTRSLPVLSWRIGDHALLGEACQADYTCRRQAWEMWVTALGLDQWAPSTSTTGRTHLHAVTRNWQDRGVDVAVIADVWEESTD